MKTVHNKTLVQRFPSMSCDKCSSEARWRLAVLLKSGRSNAFFCDECAKKETTPGSWSKYPPGKYVKTRWKGI